MVLRTASSVFASASIWLMVVALEAKAARASTVAATSTSPHPRRAIAGHYPGRAWGLASISDAKRTELTPYVHQVAYGLVSRDGDFKP